MIIIVFLCVVVRLNYNNETVNKVLYGVGAVGLIGAMVSGSYMMSNKEPETITSAD